MTQSYDAMWAKLNLDIDAHAGLLEVLGKFYGDIYLSQEGRLKGMEYMDFVLSEVHGLRIRELQDAKSRGKKVIGTFCVFVPEQPDMVGALGAALYGRRAAGNDSSRKGS